MAFRKGPPRPRPEPRPVPRPLDAARERHDELVFLLTDIRDLLAEIRDSFYSELTGYPWTDEWLKIGGHNLIKELESYRDKWAILEIEVHEEQ